jgi:hypothetical protein
MLSVDPQLLLVVLGVLSQNLKAFHQLRLILLGPKLNDVNSVDDLVVASAFS